MADIKKFFFDVETTGLSWRRCAIHQIAIIIEINGKVEDKLDWKVRPFEGAEIQPKALEVGDVTEKQIQGYPEDTEVYHNLLDLLGDYVDKFNKMDKFHLCGYNNRYFDDRFLRAWFERMNDFYFGSWFWADSLDVMVLASQHLIKERHKMKNFKLGTVAEYLGVEVQSDRLHDGLYDVEITRDIYNIIDGYSTFKDDLLG